MDRTIKAVALLVLTLAALLAVTTGGLTQTIKTRPDFIGVTGGGGTTYVFSSPLVDTAGTVSLGAITEAMITTADNTTLNCTTAKHGFVAKGTNTGSAYWRDDCTWAAIAAGGNISRDVPGVIQTTLVNSGSPVVTTIGTSDVAVQMPFAADSSVSITSFGQPISAVASSDLKLAIVYRPHAAPGVTNNKIYLKLGCNKNGVWQGYSATDTITMANNTTAVRWRGTNAKCTSVSADDVIQPIVYRVVGGANDAQVAFNITQFGFTFTDTQ